MSTEFGRERTPAGRKPLLGSGAPCPRNGIELY